MIKANVILDYSKWKNKIKDPNNYLKQKLKKLSKIPYFKKSRSFLTKETAIFPMPVSRSIDIDTMEDFKLAKKEFRN